MAYNLPWGTQHPGLLIYLVDLSGSMVANQKIQRVSNIIWEVLDSMVASCQDMGNYKDRFHVEVIGYNQYTYDIFSGNVNDLNDKLDQTADNMQFINIEKEGKAQGLTHLSMAYDKAAEIIKKWIASQDAKGQPIPAPVVINITDGFPEEKGLTFRESREKALQAAKRLQNISVPDGNVLLINIHIDGAPGTIPEMIFPYTKPTDDERGFLFEASTPLTDQFIERAKRAALPAEKNSRFMVSNVSKPKLISRIVEFGSTVSSKPGEYRETPIP